MKKNKLVLLMSILFLFSCAPGEGNSVEPSVPSGPSTPSGEPSVPGTTSDDPISSADPIVATKYSVAFEENPNVTYTLVNSETEFEKGTEVSFDYLVKAGFKLVSLSLKDAEAKDVAYTNVDNRVTFTMPESNVSVAFVTEARKTLETVNSDHTCIVVADAKEYYDAGDNVSFTIEVNEGYLLDSVKVLKAEGDTFVEVEYTEENGVYSFVFADANMKVVVTDVAVPKYHVVATENPGVTFSLTGEKTEFEEGDEVSFTYAAVYGYNVLSFSIKDASLNDIAYTGTTLISFVMPASDVTIAFVTEARKTLTVVDDDYSTVTVVDQNDYYDEGDQVSFSVAFVEGYELESVKVLKAEGDGFVEVELTEAEGVYSFVFANANMKIEVVSKEKVTSLDPFTERTVFEGGWDYDYDYYNRLRIVFNGDGTLSWYLTWQWVGVEEWAYSPTSTSLTHIKKASKPSDMDGDDLKASGENIAYECTDANTIVFTTRVKQSDKLCTLELTRDASGVVTAVTMTEDMSGDYYQCGGVALTRK